MSASLSLTKWYLDCVDDAGNVRIVYWARLAWKRLAVSYSSVITNRGGETESRESFRSVPPPRIEGDSLTWTDVAMRRRAPAYEESLIDGVRWRCVMPSADAAIEDVRGFGYAEVLDLNVAPWKLPIDELRWGRFAGAKTSLTWIDWRGPHPLTRTLLDGARTHGAVMDDCISAGDVHLAIADRRVIRDATLGETLIIPDLALPRRIARTRETKWCSRGTVTSGSEVVDRGWVIHETVKFG